ncbi:MAG: hypothetical protein ACTS44_01610 [Candidatus Hodgkinia cicadicola]
MPMSVKRLRGWNDNRRRWSNELVGRYYVEGGPILASHGAFRSFSATEVPLRRLNKFISIGNFSQLPFKLINNKTFERIGPAEFGNNKLRWWGR